MNLLKTNRRLIYIKQIHKELVFPQLGRKNDTYFFSYIKGLYILYKDIGHQYFG